MGHRRWGADSICVQSGLVQTVLVQTVLVRTVLVRVQLRCGGVKTQLRGHKTVAGDVFDGIRGIRQQIWQRSPLG